VNVVTEPQTCRIERALLVEDDQALASTLAVSLEAWADEVRWVSDFARAEDALHSWRPGLVLLDVDLPDGRGDELVELLQRVPPVPPVVAMSAVAGPSIAFRLAELGVRAYLEKPFNPDALDAAVHRALSQPPDPRPSLRASIGHRSLKDVEHEVRRTLVDEALRRAGGSRRGAGRLLGVSRQFIQQTLRRLGESD